MQVIQVWSIVWWCSLLSFSLAYITNRPILSTFSENDFVQVFQANSKRAHNHEPPQYMLDLYNQIADSKGVTKNPLPYGSSVVRAVPQQGVKHKFVNFPLLNIPTDEITLEAEFHVYHRKLNPDQRKNTNGYYKLILYEDNNGAKKYISSQELTSHSTGWRIFPISEVIKQARLNRNPFVAFCIEALSDSGITIDVDVHLHNGAKSPLMVLFNKAETKTTMLPEVLDDTDSNIRKKRSTDALSIQNTKSLSIDSTIPSEGCELREMKVNFEEIGWSSWIVFPYEYDANQCVGNCSFPLGQHLNPTNHATVQSILQRSKKNVQHPSCVPTSYDSLTLLYYDREDNVILKQYDHMIATQCGCR